MAQTVLLGSAGTGTAFAALCAIRRVWGQTVRVVAMDVNPAHLVTSSLLADAFEQVPYANDPAFADHLVGLVARHGITTYLPLVPREIALASALRDRGPLRTVSVLAPSAATSDLCADKLALSTLLADKGIRAPRTASADNLFDADSYFVKPRDGFGSRSARLLAREQVHALPHEERANLVYQSVCSPPEVTVDCFFDRATGFSRVLGRERVEVKSGVSTKCRLFEDDDLASLGLQLATALSLEGSFCFQVMRDPSEAWAVTDINPRPGAGTAMCWATGNDFLAANFARCWNEPWEPHFRPLSGSAFVTRQYADFLMGPAA